LNEIMRQNVGRGLGYLGLLLALFAALTPGYFYVAGGLALACGVGAVLCGEGYLGFLSVGFGVFGTLIGFILTLAGFRIGK